MVISGILETEFVGGIKTSLRIENDELVVNYENIVDKSEERFNLSEIAEIKPSWNFLVDVVSLPPGPKSVHIQLKNGDTLRVTLVDQMSGPGKVKEFVETFNEKITH